MVSAERGDGEVLFLRVKVCLVGSGCGCARWSSGREESALVRQTERSAYFASADADPLPHARGKAHHDVFQKARPCRSG